MNNLFLHNEGDDRGFSIKPKNVQMTVDDPIVPNFIWCCYLLFFIWKLIELVVFYAVSRKKNITALSGVKSDSCFGVFLAITILAIIIMIAMAAMGTGVKTAQSTIIAVSRFVGKVTKPVGEALNQPAPNPDPTADATANAANAAAATDTTVAPDNKV